MTRGRDSTRQPGAAEGEAAAPPAEERARLSPESEARAEGPTLKQPIEQRRRALALGFGFVALSIFVLLAAIYLQFVYQLIWASTLAVLFYPLHKRVLGLVGNRRTLAAILSTVLSILILFIPASLVLFNLVAEVTNLWPMLRDSLGPDTMLKVSQWLEESPFRRLAHLLLESESASGAAALEAELQRIATEVQDVLLERLRIVTRGTPGVIYRMGLTILAFFFFLRHGPGWLEDLEVALPMAREDARRLLKIAGQTINAVFRGTVLTAATQAVLAGLGFWVAGAPVPILLGSVTFVTALVPFVGAAGVWLPTSIGLFLSGRQGAGIGLSLFGLLVISLVDNFLRPYLIGREMRLPVLWLFFAILGALKLFGILGLVVGPAALALAMACYRIYRERRRVSA